VVEDVDIQVTARGLARQVASKAPGAVRLIKKLMKSQSTTVPERMVEEAHDFGAQLASAELREAVAAFFQKRAPDFSKIA